MDRLVKQAGNLGINDFLSNTEDLIREKQAFLSNLDNKLVKKFNTFFDALPDIKSDFKDLSGDFIIAGKENEIDPGLKKEFKETLKGMIPWRKGPFNLFGVEIDTEWRSNLKWDRFADQLDLENKRILDIGSSNGYYLFRMAEKNPMFAIGVEPFTPFYFQFKTIQKYLNLENVFTIPCTYDELPITKDMFDYVFCMGVLYHRRSPIDMLVRIRKNMEKDGILILENLIIQADEPMALTPEGRYARMNNVYFIPTLRTIKFWLEKAGFRDFKCIDVSVTDFSEQRKTEWTFDMSLEDFLDENDRSKTVEGYPAPIRAVVQARAV